MSESPIFRFDPRNPDAGQRSVVEEERFLRSWNRVAVPLMVLALVVLVWTASRNWWL